MDGAVAAVAPRVVTGVGRTAPAMRLPVVVYMAVISVTVVAAFGREVAAGVVGAALFDASDVVLAWNRFVSPGPVLALLVVVTDHLAQAALVISLLGEAGRGDQVDR